MDTISCLTICVYGKVWQVCQTHKRIPAFEYFHKVYWDLRAGPAVLVLVWTCLGIFSVVGIKVSQSSTTIVGNHSFVRLSYMFFAMPSPVYSAISGVIKSICLPNWCLVLYLHLLHRAPFVVQLFYSSHLI